MKHDYTVYPSMIGSDDGIIWSYDNPRVTATFDDAHPLQVQANKCNDTAICLWYVSPLWQFNDPLPTRYALLGELGKWTAVSRQRFGPITTNRQKTEANIAVQGMQSEVVQVLVYHSTLEMVQVNCRITAKNSSATLTITPSSVSCG
jgi:hypothetical protein